MSEPKTTVGDFCSLLSLACLSIAIEPRTVENTAVRVFVAYLQPAPCSAAT